MSHNELLHQFLSENKAVCPACNYSLSNLKADACPECGSQVRLAMAELHPVLTLPLRVVLWWSLAVNLILVGSHVTTVWSNFEPILQMARDLRMAPPSFPRFLLASSMNLVGVLVLALLAAALISAHCLIRLPAARRRPESARQIRAITFGLLAFNLLFIILSAFT